MGKAHCSQNKVGSMGSGSGHHAPEDVAFTQPPTKRTHDLAKTAGICVTQDRRTGHTHRATLEGGQCAKVDVFRLKEDDDVDEFSSSHWFHYTNYSGIWRFFTPWWWIVSMRQTEICIYNFACCGLKI